jgi:hypothetical protein
MAKEFEGYARECVLLARLADSVELLDQPIQLLRMMESSSEHQTKFLAPSKSTALSAAPGMRLLFIASQKMEIGTKPHPYFCADCGHQLGTERGRIVSIEGYAGSAVTPRRACA